MITGQNNKINACGIGCACLCAWCKLQGMKIHHFFFLQAFIYKW